MTPWWRGRPTIDGKTARGASSPAKPAFTIPEPLSTTSAATCMQRTRHSQALDHSTRIPTKRPTHTHSAPQKPRASNASPPWSATRRSERPRRGGRARTHLIISHFGRGDLKSLGSIETLKSPLTKITCGFKPYYIRVVHPYDLIICTRHSFNMISMISCGCQR